MQTNYTPTVSKKLYDLASDEAQSYRALYGSALNDLVEAERQLMTAKFILYIIGFTVLFFTVSWFLAAVL